MSHSREQILEELMRLLQPYNRQGVTLTPETDIAAELNIDSAGVMDFIMEVEDTFDIDIPLNVLSETRTVHDLADVVAARIPA